MKKVKDYLQDFPTFSEIHNGRARIRIYAETGQPAVVLCTQIPTEPASVQMLAEQIVEAVRWGRNPPDDYRWFAHFAAGGRHIPMIQRVEFVEREGTFVDARFFDTTREEVEALVGEPIE